LAALLAWAPAVEAQQRSPRVGYVFPAGGRQGSTFDVKVGGQFLAGTASAYVSGAGVQATVVEYARPITQQEVNQLREELRKLREKRAAGVARSGKGQPPAAAKPALTAEERKRLVEIAAKLATFMRRSATPMIAETVTLRVTMAADAPPGARELRLAAPQGLSNPLAFCVGRLPEFSKPAADASGELPQNLKALIGGLQAGGKQAPSETAVTLPAVVNGQIMPGGVDRYRFQARKGQQLVVAAAARELIPYISDAVPGWFQAAIALYDPRGNELAYADHYLFNPDPVLHCVVPEDGQYVVEIRDSIYRGREDFVYRITLGELPFLRGIFPLGGKVGARTTLEAQGWNLPAATVTQDAKGKPPGVYPVAVGKEDWISNRVLFAVDALPECLEQEPNDRPENAQRVALPVIVNGRIDRPGDRDVFRFEGRAGQEVVAEVHARRLGSPLDSILKLTDADGKVLAQNDDHEDKACGLITHHADSWLSARLPAGGTYYLHLGDVQNQGGPEYAYRLRISPPRPDFELRVVPSSVNARAGMSVPVTVHAVRRDGFAGDVVLGLKDPPPGFALSGGVVPARQDSVRLTLTVPLEPTDKPVELHLEGRATIEGREIRRPGIPADDMTQAFAYHHLVPAGQWLVAVIGRGRFKAPFAILGETHVRLRAGGTSLVRVALPNNGPLAEAVQFALSEPPEGIAIQNVSRAGNRAAITLRADAGKVKPGLQGNLIIDAVMERTVEPKNGQPRANKQRVPLGTLPAIPFEIM
jgi:hypothetical protein